ncbi:hypothetical protein SmJEL517_g01020 [Synchytrium microbalum]|uniref:Uncharacterized protein n=1 Tax=Synchytrium microbalum TaxID=1806994 RepID=A0A507CCB2_9FUNG|nr:uncharacterized protein SmJEL517_g01020 [Synchytrium microbalum]TPX36978.1 hypothetical protein SmJEL517_g01020 [Synchytrium microbalum]
MPVYMELAESAVLSFFGAMMLLASIPVSMTIAVFDIFGSLFAKRSKEPITFMSEELLSELRPLPEEILCMSESETACQYCGISYLLQNKYEKLERHVRQIENELRQLKHLEEERPELLERLQSAEDARHDAELTIRELEVANENAEREAEEATNELTRMQREWKTMAKQLADALASDRSKANSRNQIAIHVLSTIAKTRASIQSTKTNQTRLKQQAFENMKSFMTQIISISENKAQQKVEELRHLADQKCGHVEEELRSEIKRWQISLRESEERCERLAKSMERSNMDNADVSVKHQSYITQLEASVSDLERRLTDSDLKLEQFAREQTQLISKIQHQQTVYTSEKAELDHEAKARVVEAQRRVDQSEEKFRELSTSMKALESQCEELRSEKRNRADLYEVRMRELQDEYRQQIEELGRNHATQRRRLTDEKEVALAKVRETVTKEYDVNISNLQRQLDDLRRARDAARNEVTRMKREAEEETEKKMSALKEELRILKVKSAEELSLVRTQMLALESQLASRPPPPSTPPSSNSFFPPIHSNQTSISTQPPKSAASSHSTLISPSTPNIQQFAQEISDLKTALSRRDADLSFLRETVKMECEERMGLLSELANMKRKVQQQAQQSPTQQPQETTDENRGNKSRDGRSTPSRSNPNLAAAAESNVNPEQRAFEMRMKDALRVKESKMAKTLSGSFPSRRK